MLHSTRDTCSNLFIAALFIIEWNWKLPSCPSAKREKEIVVLLNNGISLIYGEKGNDETHNQMMKLTTKWIELKKTNNHAECGNPDSEREVYYDFFLMLILVVKPRINNNPQQTTEVR